MERKMKITKSAKAGSFERKWYIVDCAEGITLGRMAAQIAQILMGKKKAIYTPHCDTGDCVVVINAKDIRVTGNKMQSETYQRYSGYSSGQSEVTRAEMMEKKPEFVMREAVRRMLPKNRLARNMLAKLRIYAGPDHKQEGQKPTPFSMKKPSLR
jgi:large subunit ribosomal protein L13